MSLPTAPSVRRPPVTGEEPYGSRPGEQGGATLLALALAGFILLAGLAAVDVGALAAARAAAQTAADTAALAALTPAATPAAAVSAAPPTASTPRPGSPLARVESAPRPGSPLAVAGSARAPQPASAPQRASALQVGPEARAAELAAANGAELVACECSAVEAVVTVRRRQRLVPEGLVVTLTARARAVLGQPPERFELPFGEATARRWCMGIWRGVSTIRPVVTRRADLRANASAATAAVLFGVSVVAVRVAVRDVPPISLAVLRIGQGGLLLAGILLVVAPSLLRVRWERLRLFALLGLVLFALFPLTFNIGLRYTEASRGAVMLATMPIWSALLGRIAGERLTGRQFLGVGLSVVGIALAFIEPGRVFDADVMSLVGDGLLLLTGLLGAVYGQVAKRILKVDSAATVTTYAMLFGALVLLPAAVVEGVVPAVGDLTWRLLGLVVFLGVLGGSAAFLLWTWALSRLTPTQVAVYVNLNPIVAALLAILLLGERRSLLFVAGFLAVVTGVLLVNWPAERAGPGPGP